MKFPVLQCHLWQKKHDTRLEDQVEIIPWNYDVNLPITTTLDSIYNEIEEKIKSQILIALDKVNTSLNTHFCIASIYYDPSDDMDMIDTYELVAKTYSGSMQITKNLQITDWQAAKHIYHGKGVGVNPEDFGITQAELNKMKKGGLIKYVQRGNKLPSIEHVRSYQQVLKTICQDSATKQRDNSEYYDTNGVRPATTFQNDKYLISFDQTTGDLITGYKHRKKAIEKFKKTNQLDGQEWIDKWSKE